MPKKLHLTSLIILSLFIIGSYAVSALNGHSITNLQVDVVPKRPKINNPVTSLSAEFKLKSASGIDTNRIKIFINNGAIQAVADDFEITETIDEKNVRIKYTPSVDLAFTREENEFRVEYWLTRVNDNPPQASAAVTIFGRETNNSGGGSGGGGSGGGSGGGGTNGDTGNGVVQISRVLYLDVEDTSNGDTGFVSETAKQLKLIVEHDENYISFVDEDFFNANTDTVLKNLKIFSIVDDVKTNVTDQFEFTLFNGSINSDRDGYLETTYISDPIIIDTAVTLQFKVDVTSFLEKSETKIPANTVTKANASIDITPIQIDLEDLSIDENTVSFTTINSNRNNISLQSQAINISGSFDSANHVVDSVSAVSFRDVNDNDKVIKSKIKYKKKASVNISPGASSDPVINLDNGDTYSISIPTEIFINTARSTFSGGSKNPLLDTSKQKTVFTPIVIEAFNANGLELELKGTLEEDKDIEFDI